MITDIVILIVSIIIYFIIGRISANYLINNCISNEDFRFAITLFYPFVLIGLFIKWIGDMVTEIIEDMFS